jgi:hypothetical protein
MSDFMNGFTTIIATLVLALFIALVMSLPLMWLWDWLMPALFKLPEITLMQALGLNLLASILFKTTVETKK